MRVLIVDDHPDVAEMISELMTFWGHGCRMAWCARAALTALEAFEPELVLINVDLPDMSGYDLLDELSTRFRERRPLFVAITGWPDAPGYSLAAGFDRCLVKPVTLEEFREIVDLAERRLNPSVAQLRALDRMNTGNRE